jgi:hypothetical protein
LVYNKVLVSINKGFDVLEAFCLIACVLVYNFISVDRESQADVDEGDGTVELKALKVI